MQKMNLYIDLQGALVYAGSKCKRFVCLGGATMSMTYPFQLFPTIPLSGGKGGAVGGYASIRAVLSQRC